MTVVVMEAFMVRKYKLDTMARVEERVIRGHIDRLGSASSLSRKHRLQITGIK